MAGHAKMHQRVEHGFLDAIDIFLDEVARALEVDQRINHHLTGAVKRHLAAPVGLHDGNLAGVEQVVGFASNALGIDRSVLANP